MDEIFGRLGGCLTNNFGEGVRDGGMKQHASGFDPSEIDSNELALIEHHFIVGARRTVCNLAKQE